MKREVHNHVNRKRFNYGCIDRHHRGYRKALRQCKRNLQRYGVGFDDSETWNLDCAILHFLLDKHFPLPHMDFIHCYLYESSLLYLDKYYPDVDYLDCETGNSIIDSIHADILEQMRQYSYEQKQQLFDFVIPRLDRMKNITIAYPGIDEGATFEGWIETLERMIEELKVQKMDLFLKYFFKHLWW